MKKHHVRSLVLCGFFTALMCVSAFIRIPVPPVPVTLQLETAVMTGLLLGGKKGALCVGVYAVLGLAGLPVFAGGGGIGYALEPSFGYIVGFALSAYVSGLISSRGKQTKARFVVSSLIGMLAVYAVALPWYYCVTAFYVGSRIGITYLLTSCFAVFLPADVTLCVVLSLTAEKIKNHGAKKPLS